MLGIDVKKIAVEITREVLTTYHLDDILSLLRSIDKRLEAIENELKK